MNKSIAPQYLTLAEMCIYASVSKNTLKGWIKMGLPCYRIGGCTRIKVSEFDEWMRQFRTGTPKDLDPEAIWSQVLEGAKC